MPARGLASALVGALVGALVAVVGREHTRTRAQLADTRTALAAERAHVHQLRNVIALAPYARRTPTSAPVALPAQRRKEVRRARA